MRKIQVLIVDDSVFMQRLLVDLFSQDPHIEVVGTAPDPLVARMMIKRYNPDVLTLDINMPRMSGFDFLERLMRLRPMPVVMFASFGADGATEAIRALELGAIEVLAKPCCGTTVRWKDLASELIAKVKFAAAVQLRTPARRNAMSRNTQHVPAATGARNRLVAIGASTGGVQALHRVMSALPADGPPILIAQHMPHSFTASFARRLDANSAVKVVEANDGDEILPGHAYLAPGDHHLYLAASGKSLVCRLAPRTDTCAHAPSVDRLFASVAELAGPAAVGIVLSGMGRDGTQGLMRIREAGGLTIAQDQQSSLIYGMPKSARESGAAQYELSLVRIPSVIMGGSVRGARAQPAEIATIVAQV